MPKFPARFAYPGAAELAAQQRAALVTYRLCQGERLTTAQVGALTGLGYVGAWLMMTKLCAILPLYLDGPDWVLLVQS